ncbi:MAG: alpha-amylase family protein [Breznakibacter sp.]
MSKTIIYQLLPRLFGNVNDHRVFNGSVEENGCGKFNDINQAALQAITELGCTHVWYTGVLEHASVTAYPQVSIVGSNANIVKGKAGSPYAIRDYYDVCPDLAVDVTHRMAEFEDLVQRTHKAGLKCLIDFVPNHVARDYASDVKPSGVSDFGQNDDRSIPFSAQNNFYYLPGKDFVTPVAGLDQPYVEQPARVSGNDAFTAAPAITDWYETVKLNYSVEYQSGQFYFDPIPDTWFKMKEVLLYWASKGVDGFRVDMAEMVPVAFWRWVIVGVKQQFPALVFVAETYDLSQYRAYIDAGFDWLYDKEGFYNCLRSVMQGQRWASDLCSVWKMNGDIQDRLLLFLENHDEQRLASSFFMGDGSSAKPGVLVSALFNSSSALMLYFGQEVGEPGMDAEGFSGQDGRTTIFDYWGIERWQQFVNHHRYDGALLPEAGRQLLDWYRLLMKAIRHYRALQVGNFYDLTWYQHRLDQYNHATVYSFLRYDETDRFLVVANFGVHDEAIRLRMPADLLEAMKLKKKVQLVGVDVFINKIVVQGKVASLMAEGVEIFVGSKSCFLIHL